MSETRQPFSAEQNAQVVRRRLADKQPVSSLATELQVQPSVIHQVLAQAERAFERAAGQNRTDSTKERRIEQLAAKIVQKDEVIAELMEEAMASAPI